MILLKYLFSNSKLNMCFTAEQKKCYYCSEDFDEKTLLWSTQWLEKVCEDCFMKEREEEVMDCVICGEYFVQDDMTMLEGEEWCCEGCGKVEEDEDECVHYLYRCNKCDFMTSNDDIDCSNCGAKYCVMAKCTK